MTSHAAERNSASSRPVAPAGGSTTPVFANRLNIGTFTVTYQGQTHTVRVSVNVHSTNRTDAPTLPQIPIGTDFRPNQHQAGHYRIGRPFYEGTEALSQAAQALLPEENTLSLNRRDPGFTVASWLPAAGVVGVVQQRRAMIAQRFWFLSNEWNDDD